MFCCRLKRAHCLQDDWTRKRQQLPTNATTLVDIHQGTLPPNLEPFEKHLNTEQQKACRIKNSLDGNMQPCSTLEISSPSSSLSTKQQSQLVSIHSALPRPHPASGFFQKLLPEQLSTYLPVIRRSSNDNRLLSFCKLERIGKRNLLLNNLMHHRSLSPMS